MELRNRKMREKHQQEKKAAKTGTPRTGPRWTRGHEGGLAAIGYQPRPGGELGALAPDALGSVIPIDKKAAPGLHGGTAYSVMRGMGRDKEDGPQYSWLQPAHEQVRLTPRNEVWTKTTPCTCVAPSPKSVILDCSDIETADVIIVGGGPHALAALHALTEDAKDGTKGSCCQLRLSCHTPLSQGRRTHLAESVLVCCASQSV